MIWYFINILQTFVLVSLLLPNNAQSGRACHQATNHVAFTPCPPPKFDVFLDSITGSWTTKESTVLSSPSDTISSTVEEVMRSCGGAIQGMKEIEYPNSPFDRMYNNRADDGFLFFDDGSYNNGPTSIRNVKVGDDGSSDSVTNDIDFSVVSSLSFNGLSPKSRIIISTTLPKMALSLTKGVSTTHSNDDENDENDDKLILLDECPIHIKWNEEILCRMSSSSQPWMLQRAKWEKYKSKNEETNNKNEDSLEISESESSKLKNAMKCWVESCHLKLNDGSGRERMFVGSEALNSFSRTNDIAHIIQVGAMVQNDVKAFLRCYNEEGKLRGVIYQNGKLVL